MHTRPRPHPQDPLPSWPERLHALALAWHRPLPRDERERLRGRIWMLIVGALEVKIRQQAGRRPGFDTEWAYDLAVARALEILTDFAEGRWNPADHAPGQLQNYFSLLARNSVIDHVRSRAGKTKAREITDEALPERASPAAGPDRALDQERLGDALVGCAARLTERARMVWFLRVFCGMSSRCIGRHPEIRLQPGAVDMALTRSRRAIRDCLAARGFTGDDFGPGVFAACWDAFRKDHRLATEALPGEDE